MGLFDIDSETGAAVDGFVQLATHGRYADARRDVDELSDRGFDVSQVAIIWHGLRRIERVTGRRTVATAAAQGALTGAWFGTFIGLLLALFVDLDGTTEFFGIVVSYLLVGAAVGALWLGGAHWMTRGRRDFSTLDVLGAESYEIVVHPDLRAEAQTIIGTGTTRPIDPEPAAGPVAEHQPLPPPPPRRSGSLIPVRGTSPAPGVRPSARVVRGAPPSVGTCRRVVGACPAVSGARGWRAP
jgi:hypothetical protein